MNWYIKFLKYSWNRSEYYVLSTKISEEISKYIRKNYYLLKENAVNSSNIIYKGISVNIVIIVFNKKDQDVITTSGSTNIKTLELTVKIGINKYYFCQKYFKLLWRKIYLSVRHEIEHIKYLREINIKNKTFNKGYDLDKMMNSNDIVVIFDERVKYLSQEYEKTAFIRALKDDSVRNKISLISSIKKFIHEQLFFKNNIQENVVKEKVGERAIQVEQKLINDYIESALIIYPLLLNSRHIKDEEKGI